MCRACLIRISGECLRETEVEHFHDTVARDHDVRGLQITVDDALVVRGLERLGDLQADA